MGGGNAPPMKEDLTSCDRRFVMWIIIDDEVLGLSHINKPEYQCVQLGSYFIGIAFSRSSFRFVTRFMYHCGRLPHQCTTLTDLSN